MLFEKLFSFAGLFQHHLHPVEANITQRAEAVWASLTVLLYVLHFGRKKNKAENNKNTGYKSGVCVRVTLASNKVRPSLPPVNLTHLHP